MQKICFILLLTAIYCCPLDALAADYKVVDWSEANDMASAEDVVFLMQIEYNGARVFQKKELLIVLAINPYSKAIITSNRALLDSWIEDRSFPIEEITNPIYYEYRDLIEELPVHAQSLTDKLTKETGISIKSDSDIDMLHRRLQHNINFEELKFYFIIAVGDFLKAKDKSEKIRWGIRREKQFLNPFSTIVLTKEDDKGILYFELESKIAGKWGFSSAEWLMHYFNGRWRRVNDFEEVTVL